MEFKSEFNLRKGGCNNEELNNHERKPLKPCEDSRTKKKIMMELMENNFNLSMSTLKSAGGRDF